ncbi:MAG: cytochrome c oxidase assembly protein [Gammaproteobacteria bacterium]|nr:cytochrome c oxidase assembly protein [Gammaproteobacteria bacterium]
MTEPQKPKAKPLALRLLAIAVVMFGFGFLLVPLYDIFCAITGLRAPIEQVAETDIESSEIAAREVTIEMVANRNNSAPWEFRPSESIKVVDTGSIYETSYFARNLLDEGLTATAAPDIRPVEAAKYFKKIECFCFTAQEFGPEESKDMLVRFMVSKDLPKYIDRITLSYTLYATPKVAGNNQ